MGCHISKKQPLQVVLLGASGGGKTTVVQQLSGTQDAVLLPTSNFNMETVMVQGTPMTVWDLSGKSDFMWRAYVEMCDAMVFVVDASGDLEAQAKVLDTALALDESGSMPLLVLANKQDVAHAAKRAAVTTALGLAELTGRVFLVQETAAKGSGDGVHEGMDWLLGAVAPRGARSRRAAAAKKSNKGFIAVDD